MPRLDGMQVLARALEIDPDAVIIMITGHGTVESAVEAMRARAFDYLLKPLPSNDALRLAVERAAARRHLIEENRRLREPLAPRLGFESVVGKSAAMTAVFDLVRKAARSDVKPGMMEVADRGTLFLDELGELPLALQPKLLRALQERQIRHVGGTKTSDARGLLAWIARAISSFPVPDSPWIRMSGGFAMSAGRSS
jgi:DNA-binding NtrC family response regulator